MHKKSWKEEPKEKQKLPFRKSKLEEVVTHSQAGIAYTKFKTVIEPKKETGMNRKGRRLVAFGKRRSSKPLKRK